MTDSERLLRMEQDLIAIKRMLSMMVLVMWGPTTSHTPWREGIREELDKAAAGVAGIDPYPPKEGFMWP